MKPFTTSILIVDDEVTITELLSRQLCFAGYDCVTASNGVEALKCLEEQSFALMIADIRMPEMDGTELLERVREAYPDMMVLMLTGVADTGTAVASMKQGAYDYILKPFNIDELLLSVRRALEHRELTIQNREYQRHLEVKVEERTRLLKQQHKRLQHLYQELETSFYDTIRVFISLMELYEPFLGSHVRRVAALSITLARHLGLPKEDVHTIEISALLHDIGLVGISQHLMTKKRTMLSAEEFELIKQGPVLGQAALQPIRRLDHVGCIIRAQHEHYDGSGFPDGLAGDQIPYEARLLAVTNAYDAMRFKRIPSMSLSTGEAIVHLRNKRGRQFDPELVDAFLQMLREHHDEPRKERRVRLDELTPGMRLSRSIQGENGVLLVARNTVLTEITIDKLKRLHKIYPLKDVFVYTELQGHEEAELY